jgi:hypothetical protein
MTRGFVDDNEDNIRGVCTVGVYSQKFSLLRLSLRALAGPRPSASARLTSFLSVSGRPCLC